MNLFRIIPLSLTNCYLFKASDGYLLIDCGYQHSCKSFMKALKRFHIEPSEILCLLLTHHHNDHCGLIDFLITLNPRIRLIMSSKCAQYISKGVHFKPASEIYANSLLGKIMDIYFKLGRNRSESFNPYFLRDYDIIVRDDCAISLPDFDTTIQILLTPGHTEDSISVILEKEAFVGDAVRNSMNFLGSPFMPIILYDMGVCFKSWEKIIDTGVTRIYPAHGRSLKTEKLLKALKSGFQK